MREVETFGDSTHSKGHTPACVFCVMAWEFTRVASPASTICSETRAALLLPPSLPPLPKMSLPLDTHATPPSLSINDCACDVPSRMLNTPFGRANWVPLLTFFDVFLPRLPASIDIDTVFRRLKRRRAPFHRIITKDGCLWGYSIKKPADFDDNSLAGRVNAFKHLYACAHNLVKVLPGSTQKFWLHSNEKQTWYRNERSEDALPDAYLSHSEDNGHAPNWTTIAISGTYTLKFSEDMAVYVRSLPLSPEWYTQSPHFAEYEKDYACYGQLHVQRSAATLHLWLHARLFYYETVVL